MNPLSKFSPVSNATLITFITASDGDAAANLGALEVKI